jgi:putative FmdB family regulatory protein
MPIYEYRCAACGHELEALQKLADPPLAECPACHKRELRKLVSAAGFQLKGSGWYVTDFRDKATKPAKEKAAAGDGAAKPNGDGAPAATSGDSAKAENKGTDKAATSTETKPAPTTPTPKSEA